MAVPTLDIRPFTHTYPHLTQTTPIGAPERKHLARTGPVSVAVLADDPVTEQGAVACLQDRPDLEVLPASRRCEAEVLLILVHRVTEQTLARMQAEATAAQPRDLRFVLVGDGIREHQMLRAVTNGLVSALPRREADFDRIAQAIRHAREDRPELPPVALGWLIKQIRAVHCNVLAPNGLTATGLETREADVLRLLSEGLDTLEIAEELKYSERTVKNIIHGLLTRFKLRNRAHAVSFALRNNLL
jgi:DNA-binding NarL/FixJ family response regulator